MPTTLTRTFNSMIRKHPDRIIEVRIKYSPGVVNKVEPFFHAVADVSGVDSIPAYSPSREHSPVSSPEQALLQLEEVVDHPSNVPGSKRPVIPRKKNP